MNKQSTKVTTKSTSEQYYVGIQSKKEWAQMLNYLIDNQYENPQNCILKVYPSEPYVLCVDTAKKRFFGTNVTCLACAVSVGKRVINFNEFKNYMA